MGAGHYLVFEMANGSRVEIWSGTETGRSGDQWCASYGDPPFGNGDSFSFNIPRDQYLQGVTSNRHGHITGIVTRP